ncbi:hypothetical protein DQQ01_14385 [Blautia argi]|uniref:Uncharacterized protein n=1 Tax=Blautia argi TaxID=1912897 RepID=A0A2Z4UDW6_9FIRM|nr:hypothetical protein DQQ01_14385 [Blautia argi]
MFYRLRNSVKRKKSKNTKKIQNLSVKNKNIKKSDRYNPKGFPNFHAKINSEIKKGAGSAKRKGRKKS